MTFDPVHVETLLSNSTLVAMFWLLPVIALAFRAQSTSPPLRRSLLIAILILSAGATLPTLAGFHLLPADRRWFTAAVLGFLLSVFLAGLAFLLTRVRAGKGTGG